MFVIVLLFDLSVFGIVEMGYVFYEFVCVFVNIGFVDFIVCVEKFEL